MALVQVISLTSRIAPQQLVLSGRHWHERCYPFRGVFEETQMSEAVILQRRVDDFRQVVEAHTNESGCLYAGCIVNKHDKGETA